MKQVVKAIFKVYLLAQKIEVELLRSLHSNEMHASCMKGKEIYKPTENATVWKIRCMVGMKESISVEVELLPSYNKIWA